MYDKILVPLDGSVLAEQVLPYVRPLAKALVASIELLHTIPPAGPELADLAPLYRAIQTETRDQQPGSSS
jgi:nucleotide-binding universal stress UspA family protein